MHDRELTEESREEYLEIATDLGYPQSVLDKIKDATTEHQAEHILIDARHAA